MEEDMSYVDPAEIGAIIPPDLPQVVNIDIMRV